MTQKQTPLLLLIVDGFGLSTSTKGNAISMANPAGFFDIWQSYPHAALRVNPTYIASTGFLGNPEICHTAIGNGYYCPPLYDHINESINDGTFFENETLCEAFKYSTDHFSNTHLIGVLSANKRYGDISHLCELIRLAGKLKNSNLLVHLVLDSSYNQISQAYADIDRIETELLSQGVGRIASIAGIQNFLSNNPKHKDILLALKSMINGEGSRSLSAEQALRLAEKDRKEPCSITPTVIIEGNKAHSFRDFDSVVYFSHDITPLKMISFYLLDMLNIKIRRQAPKLLLLTSLGDPSFQKSNFKSAFSQNFYSSLLSALTRNDKDYYVVSESSRLKHFFNFFYSDDLSKNSYFAPLPRSENDYLKSYEQIIKDLATEAKELLFSKDKDLVILEIPLLEHLSSFANFTQIVSAVKFLDGVLLDLVKTIESNDATILITANHGSAEELSPASSINANLNPVPVILVNKELKKPRHHVLSNNFMLDLMNIKYDLANLAPTILTQLDLPIPYSMIGENIFPS